MKTGYSKVDQVDEHKSEQASSRKFVPVSGQESVTAFGAGWILSHSTTKWKQQGCAVEKWALHVRSIRQNLLTSRLFSSAAPLGYRHWICTADGTRNRMDEMGAFCVDSEGQGVFLCVHRVGWLFQRAGCSVAASLPWGQHGLPAVESLQFAVWDSRSSSLRLGKLWAPGDAGWLIVNR